MLYGPLLKLLLISIATKHLIHFLDVRAEILQIFRVKFWKILDAEKSI